MSRAATGYPTDRTIRYNGGMTLQPIEQITTDVPLIEAILTEWRSVLRGDYAAYRGHVYRVYIYCVALADHVEELESKTAVAACFHDLAIWTHRTLDYVEFSAEIACQYLHHRLRRPEWEPDITRMIRFHHQLTPYYRPQPRQLPHTLGENRQLIESFRRADLIDLSLGAITFGLPYGFIQATRRAFPPAGFYWRLVQLNLAWSLRHPLRPLPMLRRQ